MLWALLATVAAFAGKCPTVNGTFEKEQNYGMSFLSIHVRHKGKKTELSRDNVHFYPPDGSKHIELDDQFGDSAISFECRKGKIIIHQDLVKPGKLMSSSKAISNKAIPGTMILTPAGKNLKVEVSGENPVLKLVTGGLFTRKKAE